MKFSYFPSPQSQHGELCTAEKFHEVSDSVKLLTLCNTIFAETDKHKRAELKKQLPVITWQAYFPDRRLAKNAQPSGLFMLDIDHIEEPGKIYATQIASRVNDLDIVFVQKTASRQGLRIIAKCRPEFRTIEECQKWLSEQLGVEYDPVCKDMARCSFVVHSSYTLFANFKAIFEDEPQPGTVYEVESRPAAVENTAFAEACFNGNFDTPEQPEEKKPTTKKTTASVDQREGLFGGVDEYENIPLATICKEWLKSTGGEPSPGVRNTRLYQLAVRMRYLTDFNEANMFRVMPNYGLDANEMKSIIHSACQSVRATQIPRDLQIVIEKLKDRQTLEGDFEELPTVQNDISKLPPLPPIFQQLCDIAPDDFKRPVILSQLPILGTLASKLRARYLDGNLTSPSFLVCVEAPQASGKSFIVRLCNFELASLKEHDENERTKEREYQEKIKEMKLLNVKVTVENKQEILGTKPRTLVRFVPPTMSITKLLQRASDAQGLHLFALAEEVDTVVKAFKRGFSSYSDALRIAFDNGEYGQDYASENSFSGTINLFYNCLFSGTPKAMRRFFPDVEDGLVSRVLFVTLNDQFGKKMPVWKTLTKEQRAICDVNLERLNEISIQGNEVQEEHVMNMNFLHKHIEKWILQQQARAVEEDDRTRDIFCRRAALVGFRAGMLAFFLYGESHTPTVMRKVAAFSIYVADCMLTQHLLRFNVTSTNSNTIVNEDVFTQLPKQFTRQNVEQLLIQLNHNIPVKNQLYKWKMAGVIKEIEYSDTGKKKAVKFEKTV